MDQGRRTFIQGSALAGGLGTLGLMGTTGSTVAAAASASSYTVRSTASGDHRSAIFIDTESMPWTQPVRGYGWRIKSLFENSDTGDRLVLIDVPIGSPGGLNHYHDFHEWVYWLTGDFVNNEYTSPYQRVGPFTQFREGTFLDRPAYSLHGYEHGRLESQVGGSCLIMEEGGRTINVVPGESGYSDEFKEVDHWANPRIIDTIRDQPWEPDPDADGVMIKYLVENQRDGFRAVMRRLPAGWSSEQAPEFAAPYFYRKAHQFNFVLAGDMRLQTFSRPGSKAETIHATRYYHIERPPMSVFGLAEGTVSDAGCVWLEVTYGEGTSLSSTPVEEKIIAS